MSPCIKVSAMSVHGGGGIPPVMACRQHPNSWRSRVFNEKVQNMVHWSGTHPNKVQKAGDAFLRPSPPQTAGPRNGIPLHVHACSFFFHLQRTFNKTTSLDSFLHLSLMPPQPQIQTRHGDCSDHVGRPTTASTVFLTPGRLILFPPRQPLLESSKVHFNCVAEG